MTDRPLHEDLEFLRGNAAAAAKRLRDAEVAARQAARAVGRAEAALNDFQREAARAGVEADAGRLEELRAAVVDARARIRVERVLSGGKPSDVRELDPEAQAVVEGAREGVEEADRALVAFERQHDAALIAERLQDRLAERDGLIRAARAFLDAERDWADGLRVEERHARAVGRPLPEPDYPALDAMRELSAWLRRVEGDPGRLVPVPEGVRGMAA